MRALFDGVWLGLLDDQDLEELAERYYRGTGDRSEQRYLEESHNRQGLWPWEVAALEEHFPPSGRVVVTGAGAGREVLALLDRGFDAVGFECGPELVAFGRELLGPDDAWRLSLARPGAWPAAAERCDAVIVGWGSYMLTPGRDRRVAFLRAARAAMPAGGPLLLSFWARDGASTYFRLVQRVGSLLRRCRRRPPLDLGDGLNGHFVHSFSQEQLAEELHAAGLAMELFATDGYARAVARAGPHQTTTDDELVETPRRKRPCA